MGRTALRRATVVLTAALVLTVTFSPSAHAADAGLTAAMLDTGDLPAGFTPDASLTGPLTSQRAQELGLNPGQTWAQDTWVRTWRAADGAEVIETAVDAGTGDHARAGAASGVSVLQEQGATRQPVTGFDVYGGYVGQYFELVLPLARGPYLFGLHVLAPGSSAGSAGRLMSEIGAAQVRKVPADTPDTAPASDAAGAAGAVVGALIGYLLLADGVGYLRNPLRRKLWRPRSRRVQPGAGPRRRRRCIGGRQAHLEDRRRAAGGPAGRPGPGGLRGRRVPGPLLVRVPGGRAGRRLGRRPVHPSRRSGPRQERRDHGRVAPDPGHRHADRGVVHDPVRPGGDRVLRPVSDPAAGSHRAEPAGMGPAGIGPAGMGPVRAGHDHRAEPGHGPGGDRSWACWSWARSSSGSPGGSARSTRAG